MITDSYSSVLNTLEKKDILIIKDTTVKLFSWVLLATLGLIAPLYLFWDMTIEGAFYLFLLGMIGPLWGLLMSKSQVKKTLNIKTVNPNNFLNNEEKTLYEIVALISRRAGIKEVPEVCIYQSDDMNAFATGASKNSAMVAFSTGLLEKMDTPAIAGVVAHEIGHIINGDMVTMTILQGIINVFVLVLTMPFRFVAFVYILAGGSRNPRQAAFMAAIVTFVGKVVERIFLFLANLIVKAFSRHREYQADEMAALIGEKEYMASALQALKNDSVTPSQGQLHIAALKINNSSSLFEFFSTHPLLDNRANRLSNIPISTANVVSSPMPKWGIVCLVLFMLLFIGKEWNIHHSKSQIVTVKPSYSTKTSPAPTEPNTVVTNAVVANSSTINSSTPISLDDFGFNGVRLGDNISLAQQKFGQVKSKIQKEEGLSYNFDNIEVITNSQGRIINIITDQSALATRRNIRVGSNLSAITSAYGSNYSKSSYPDTDLYEFELNSNSTKYILRFALNKNGNVQYIGARTPVQKAQVNSTIGKPGDILINDAIGAEIRIESDGKVHSTALGKLAGQKFYNTRTKQAILLNQDGTLSLVQ